MAETTQGLVPSTLVLPLIHVIAGPLSVAAYVNVDCIDIGLVELNFCKSLPSLVCAVAIT